MRAQINVTKNDRMLFNRKLDLVFLQHLETFCHFLDVEITNMKLVGAL